MRVSFCIAIFFVFVLSGLAHTAPTEGLVAYYQFENDATDASGNGNDGTIYEATFLEGVEGLGIHFDGIDDHVRVPNSTSINTSTFTVAFWWSFDEIVEQNSHMIDKKNGYNHHNYVVYLQRDSDFGIPGGGLTLRTEASAGPSSWLSAEVHSVDLEADRFYFIAATYDQSTLKLFLDGEVVAQASGTVTGNTGDGDLVIAGRGDLVEDRFTNGICDELRIYNRALSEAEIQELYSPAMTADLDIAKFFVVKNKQTDTTIMAMSGLIENFPELDLVDGDIVGCDVTIELSLPDGDRLIISGETDLTVKDRRKALIIKK